MKTCEVCGTKEGKICYSKKHDKTLCRKCYNYEKNHPVHPLPKKGEVEYDDEGKLICHICGRAFRRLSSHAFRGHGVSAYTYKEMFGLNNNTGLLIESTKEMLREYNKNNYEKVVKENLINKGKDSRFKKGSKGRTRDKIRLQCKNVLIQNTFKSKK